MIFAPAIPQATRTALEFPAWYQYKAGKGDFRSFTFQLLSQQVLNRAEVKTVDIKTTDDPSTIVTLDDSDDDYRRAFGRVLAGHGVVRVNGAFVVRFPVPNWVRITCNGDNSRSHCLRKASVVVPRDRKDGKPKIIGWEEASDELRRIGSDAWYQPGQQLEFKGMEAVELWVLRGNLTKRQLSALEDANETSSRCKPSH